MENSSEQATIAIVDDHPIYRQGLTAVFRAEARFKVVAEGASTADALDIAKAHRPSILVLDLGIPGDSLETLRQLCVEFPGTHCVILTACDDPQTGIAALNAGAHGYILKGVSASELKAAIWAVFKNESSFVSPEFAARLLSAVQRKEAVSIDVGLSHRELQIIAEVESGATNRMVADKLKISEKTVKHYMSSIMQKCGATNRVSAVMAYQRMRQSGQHA
ncbi:two-component system nitrate/nitrite response regulator NarL [Bradyrhizobium sp. GM2.2]|uniref:response regulator transcription factor n=1 Tax=Bradyrhizobium sp. GM2.2 TaxID=3156358 RepID=UPI00339AA781